MKLIPIVVLLVAISTASGWARLGETIDQLYKRYGTASQLRDEKGGLTVVEFNKGSVILTFELLDLKAEGLEAKGLINKAEAEVIMARNIPNQTFEIDVDPATPFSDSYVFWHTYTFSDGSVAVYFRRKDSDSDQSVVIITSPKKQAYDKLRKEQKKADEKKDANRKVDLLETPEGKVQMSQDSSSASMDTALGRYQHKLYQEIGSRWNYRVQQTMAQIGVDRVVVRFHVNADGSISDLDIIQGNPNSMIGVISGDAIQQSSNVIGPFPADLKAEMPNGFPWQLAFRVY